MEINKQLFEDVLSGKLKGVFVLKNKQIVKSDTLKRSSIDNFPYEILIEYGNGITDYGIYKSNGDFESYNTSYFDIIDFIPDTDMNELTIENPKGKEIDWVENYNNMVYEDQEFKSFEEIFNYGLSLCKWWKKKKAQDFFTAYIYYLYNVNTREDVPTIEYAEQCAKKNFGYFAGYYGDDVRKKIYDYFEAVHPVFGNRYNVTNKEAFYAGMQRALAKEKIINK